MKTITIDDFEEIIKQMKVEGKITGKEIMVVEENHTRLFPTGTCIPLLVHLKDWDIYYDEEELDKANEYRIKHGWKPLEKEDLRPAVYIKTC